MPRAHRIRPARLAIAAATVAGAVVLAGCTADAEPEPETTSAAPEATPTASSTPSSTPTPEPEATSVPIAFGCDELLTLDEVYAYNPNVTAEPSTAPLSDAQQAVLDADGISCSLVNNSSGEVIQVGVAQLTVDALTEKVDGLMTSSQYVPTYGVDGFFQQVDGLGQAEVFADPYWIVATSSVFVEPGEATQLVEAAIDGLPAA